MQMCARRDTDKPYPGESVIGFYGGRQSRKLSGAISG